MLKSLLWPWEVGRAVGLSARTVCRLADAGEVDCIRDGRGRRRFRPGAAAPLRAKLGIPEVEAGAHGGGTAAGSRADAADGIDQAAGRGG